MGSVPNWYQIGNETCYIAKVSKFYVEKGYLCLQTWKCHHWHVSFTDQNIMEMGDPMVLNFEGLGMQKWNIPTDRAQRVDEKMGSFV